MNFPWRTRRTWQRVVSMLYPNTQRWFTHVLLAQLKFSNVHSPKTFIPKTCNVNCAITNLFQNNNHHSLWLTQSLWRKNDLVKSFTLKCKRTFRKLLVPFSEKTTLGLPTHIRSDPPTLACWLHMQKLTRSRSRGLSPVFAVTINVQACNAHTCTDHNVHKEWVSFVYSS